MSTDLKNGDSLGNICLYACRNFLSVISVNNHNMKYRKKERNKLFFTIVEDYQDLPTA